jgi:hypothetical protein
MSNLAESVPNKPNQGMQAAKASWMAPIVGVFLNLASSGAFATAQQKAIIGFSSLAIYAIGLILGIFALSKIQRYGRDGILAPAIIGVVINGILVLLFAAVIATVTMARN